MKMLVFAAFLLPAGLGGQGAIMAGDSGAPPAIPEMELKAGGLSGLFLDAGPGAPVILIVPGSGPTDRDGNSPLGVNANIYKHLAEQLAERGISTLRVDKHGMFASAGAGDPNAVTVESYAADYRRWIRVTRTATGAPCIFLLGHSEGAMMVSAAAVGQPDVCGLLLVSGAGRPFGDVLREQLKANPANAPLLDQAFAAIRELEAGEPADRKHSHPAIAWLFDPSLQGFLTSVMTADPAALAKAAAVRTLVVQGATDLQTSLADAEALADATDGRLAIIEGVNHVLKEAPGEPAANLATYAMPNLPVAEPVIDAIADFVRE